MKINFKAIGNVLKKNAPTICAIAASIGVVVTAVLSSKAAVKAHEAIVEAEEHVTCIEEVDAVEKFKIAFPIYIPTIIAGTVTVACILTGNALGAKMQAQLLAGYVAAEQQFKKYREKTQELYGEGADSAIKEETTVDQFEEEKQALVDKKIIGKQLFYDENSQQFFWSTKEQVRENMHVINMRLSSEGELTLTEYCAILEIPAPKYADITGWNTEYLLESGWDLSGMIDYGFKAIETSDNDIPEYFILMTNIEHDPANLFVLDDYEYTDKEESVLDKIRNGVIPFDWHWNTEEERNELFLKEKAKVMPPWRG